MTTPAAGRRVVRADAAAGAARRPRRARRVLVLGCVVVLLVAAAVWALLGSSLLGVRELVVTGSRIADPEQIRAAAAVPIGTPLLRVDTGAVAERVRMLAPVADASVSRSLPHTLVITVTERSPAAVAAEPAGFAVISADGTVFDHVASPPPGVVVIRVASPGAGDAATLAALRVAAALTPRLRSLAAEVVAPTPTTITVALTDGRVVLWGDADDSELKASVATTLLDRAAYTIDVTVPDVASVT